MGDTEGVHRVLLSRITALCDPTTYDIWDCEERFNMAYIHRAKWKEKKPYCEPGVPFQEWSACRHGARIRYLLSKRDWLEETIDLGREWGNGRLLTIDEGNHRFFAHVVLGTEYVNVTVDCIREEDREPLLSFLKGETETYRDFRLTPDPQVCYS